MWGVVLWLFEDEEFSDEHVPSSGCAAGRSAAAGAPAHRGRGGKWRRTEAEAFRKGMLRLLPMRKLHVQSVQVLPL
ncbi:MAG: hypothetical protein N2652_11855 [Kiritimatiellae bacterium]|nr:hypothetical protein [Kiritimatiellia bacterium]